MFATSLVHGASAYRPFVVFASSSSSCNAIHSPFDSCVLYFSQWQRCKSFTNFLAFTERQFTVCASTFAHKKMANHCDDAACWGRRRSFNNSLENSESILICLWFRLQHLLGHHIRWIFCCCKNSFSPIRRDRFCFCFVCPFIEMPRCLCPVIGHNGRYLFSLSVLLPFLCANKRFDAVIHN